MFTLAATNTLAGVADAATQVTVTVMGMELSGSTETYKVLYQGQLAASAATLYTVPGSTSAFVKTVTAVNSDASNSHQFQLFVNGTAAANAITPLVTIPAGGMATYEDERGWVISNASGQQLISIYDTVPTESNYGIAGSEAETIPRNICPEVNTTGPASGTLWLQAIFLKAGTVVTNICFYSATTAANTPTNQVFGLYDASRNLLATTNDDTTTAWGANTFKSLDLTSPYTVPTTGIYYLGLLVVATTVPTYKGGAAKTGGHLSGVAPLLQGSSSTGLTALPSNAAAISSSTASIWGCVR